MVAEPSITRIATSSSCLKPRAMAQGSVTAASPTSFMMVAHTALMAVVLAFLKSKDAPIAISPIGVAIAPIFEIADAATLGMGIFTADQIRPAQMAIIIGFVTMPRRVFFTMAPSMPFPSGEKNERTITAITL